MLIDFKTDFAPIVPFCLDASDTLVLDLSNANIALKNSQDWDTVTFDTWLKAFLQENNKKVAIGGYLEDRSIYCRSQHFGKDAETRSVHLGTDIWAEAGTPVYAPTQAKVHSFQNNANFGDYGPTIILEHQIQGITFYTLYGHLSLESLQGKYVGQHIGKGENLATFGTFPINGDWSPHLHFQIIMDLEGKTGDYVGVCKPSDTDFYKKNCPNPNFILQSNLLIG